MQHKKYKPSDISGELGIYFTWAINALFPIGRGAKRFLFENELVIRKMSQKLLKDIDYKPGPIYRGIILKDKVSQIEPEKFNYHLSFSTDRSVAENFADINGFGSEHEDLKSKLGEYGYLIEYTPKLSEVVFHYSLLSILPFEEAFNNVITDGRGQVEFLKTQKEVTILQPTIPFLNITPQF
jgi:hypothetical protein